MMGILIKKGSIRARVITLAVLPVILVSFILSYFVTVSRLDDVEIALKQKGNLLVDYLSTAAEYAVYIQDTTLLGNLVDTRQHDPDITKIVIYDINKNILAKSTEKQATRLKLNINKGNRRIEPITFSKAIHISGIEVFDYDEPLSSKSDHSIAPKKTLLGWVEVVLSPQSMLQQQSVILKNSIVIILLGLAVGVILALRMEGKVTKPILRLTALVNSIEQGKYNIVVEHNSIGELGTLEKGFNSMVTKISESHTKMQATIEEATNELREIITTLEIKNQELDEARQKALDAGRAKEEFLARMSHEIRTPMNAVIGYTKLLEKTGQDDVQKEHTRIIAKASHQLLTVIDDVLSYSKLESGSVELEKIEFDIQESMEDVVSMLSNAAHQKGLELVLLIHSEVPTTLIGDPERINQILINLVNNSIKFTEAGQIVIHVEKTQDLGTKEEIKVSVVDTGVGIAREVQKHLFDEFTQADSSITRRFGGTGLGLTIAKKFTELMGGRIEVESTPGKGSKFYFTIQCEKTDSKTSNMVFEQLDRRKILIYDQNQYSLRSLRNNCIRWDVEVYTARNTKKLFSQLLNYVHMNNLAYEMLIIGLSMEESQADRWNGFYSQVRMLYSGPILILTGEDHNDYIKDKVANEKVLCEIKPIRKNTLYKNICTLLDIDVTKGVISTNKIVENECSISDKIVLVVEDNEFNQMLIKELLVASNCEPIIVSSAAQAIETVRSQPIDLILMDIHLPDMSGIEASRIITANKNSTERPIIIALTADVFIDNRELLKKSGIDDCILKPIREDTFWSVINSWIADSKTNRLLHTKTGQTEAILTLGSNGVLSDKLYSEMDRLLTLIEHSLKCRDKEKLSKNIHELKGLAGYYQIEDIAKGSEKIETLIHNKDQTGILDELNRIREILKGE